MNYIKSLTIEGLKKFEHFDIEFDKNINIIIGENESGKSTILEAINICLNQLYRNADKSIIKELLNISNVNKFKENPSLENLPKIYIEIEFNLDKDSKNNFLFYGMHNQDENEKYGIKYTCELNKEFEQEVFEFIKDKKIPYEYYEMKWTTFQGASFNILKQPLNYLTIDNSITTQYNTYNYYNKSVFKSKYDGNRMVKVKNDFRINIEDIFSDLKLEKISDTQQFGIDTKKVILENIIAILDNDVLLENKGKGIENLLKTQIALDKVKSKLDVVSIEEPENHLSHTNLRKMLKNIETYKEDKQIIITTHSNLIVSGLNVQNIIWINNEKAKRLGNIDKDIAKFFQKSDNNSLLQFLLAKKVILVEGATEYILIPKIFKKILKKTLEEENIDIISCNGVTYKNFIHIAELMKKKVVVITDNDESQEKINEMNEYNQLHNNIKIYMDSNMQNWTWEVCLYNLNASELKNIIEIEDGAKYSYKGISYEDKPVLGKMLNNKSDTAYKIYMSNKEFEYPSYVTEALEWIKKIILAVAGAGKTYTLCKNVDDNKRNIILAFTNQNIKNIIKELDKNHHKTLENTCVYTFDSFKYNFFIRPYEPIIARHFGIKTFVSKGVSLKTPPPKLINGYPNPNYKNNKLFEHYVIGDKYYCDNLSELILQVKKGKEYNLFDIAMKNINNFFDYIYIDEFQDFRQHNYELMEKIIKKSNNIVLVGDYFQHSVNARNNTGKPFKVGNTKETKRIITYEEYIKLLENLKLKVDTETLKKTRRCPENICKFIREKFNIEIYADNNNKGNVIFLENNDKIKEIIENNYIIKLVESDSKIYNFNCINWGYSKGDTYNDICVILTDRFKNLKEEKNIEYTSTINKIYVALTRTKGNLYIIEKAKFDNIKNSYIKTNFMNKK